MGHHLLTGRLPLRVLQAALQDNADQFVQFVGRVDAILVQEFVRQFRQAKRLEVLDFKGRLDGLAAQVGVRRGRGQGDVHDARFAGFRALHLFAEARGHGVLEGELLVDAELGFFDRADNAVAVARGHVGREDVADFGLAAGLGHDLAVRREETPFFLGDFLVGEGMDDALDLEALVIGQIKLRPYFDFKFIHQRPVSRHLDGGGVDVGMAERRDVVVLGELFEAGE